MLQLHAGAALEVAQLLLDGGDDTLEVRFAVLVVVTATQVQIGEEGAVGREMIEEGCVRG